MLTQIDIDAASKRIERHVRKTPVIRLNHNEIGIANTLDLKLELFQHTGTFKARGAFNALTSMSEKVSGVVAASGGNHGAAVAFAAQQLNIKADVFVPQISSQVKIDRIKSYGATVHITGEKYQDALEASQQFMDQHGGVSIHAYDQYETIQGQATLGKEWDEQSPELDTILVSVGGGGLVGGLASWFQNRVKIVAVEPQSSCCLYQARSAGEPVDVDVSGIAADSLGARRIGGLSFQIAQNYVDDVVLVSDDDIEKSKRLLWEKVNIAAEPGGATSLAALVGKAYQPDLDERVGVLVCGGNVDLTKLIA